MRLDEETGVAEAGQRALENRYVTQVRLANVDVRHVVGGADVVYDVQIFVDHCRLVPKANLFVDIDIDVHEINNT